MSDILNDRLRKKHDAQKERYGDLPQILPKANENTIDANIADENLKDSFENTADLSENTDTLPFFSQSEWNVSEKPIKKVSHFKEYFFNILMSLACVYIIFLIFGCLCTDYQYNEKGVIVPQSLSVSDVREKKKFEKIYYQYLNVMDIYKKLLVLDYRVANNKDGNFIPVANDYEATVSDIKNVYTKLSATTIDPKYSELKEMLLSLLYSEDNSSYANFNSYCSAMSTALSKNSEKAAATAESARMDIYNYFSLITSNVLKISEDMNGMDVTAIKNFNPDTYAEDKSKSLVD